MNSKRFITKQNATIEFYGLNASMDALMVNLSQTGAAFLLSNHSFSPNKGDLLNITVKLDTLARTRNVDAEIVWIKGTEIGVCFIPKDEVVERMLNRGPRVQ